MPAMEVRRWTRDEYERMIRAGIFAPEERVELIDGEILYVPPQGTPHATAICLGLKALMRVFNAGFEVRPQLPIALDPSSEPEPDLAVVRGTARDYRDEHPETPVLIVEVADSSLTHDQVRKGSLYARARIPEYWIVNLFDRRLEVYRDPVASPHAWFGWDYATPLHFGPAESVAPLAAPDSPVAVADLLP